MEELIDMIANVGFPMAICVYLIYQQQTTMKEVSKALIELRYAIEELRRL